jgi:hypothetical protein
MPDVRLPLSGNVSQTINPWTWMFNPVGSQTGLINVDVGSSADPELEQTMLKDVGSYGRQLGRIGDALLVLLNHVHLDELTPAEEEAIAALRAQLKSVNDTKARVAKVRGTPLTEAPVTPDAPVAAAAPTSHSGSAGKENGQPSLSAAKRSKAPPKR